MALTCSDEEAKEMRRLINIIEENQEIKAEYTVSSTGKDKDNNFVVCFKKK